MKLTKKDKNFYIGKKFGKLIIIKYIGTNKHRFRCYECKCECGNTKIIMLRNILKGFTKSCGCLQAENMMKVALKFNSKNHPILLEEHIKKLN